jgi:sRNA-binding protein
MRRDDRLACLIWMRETYPLVFGVKPLPLAVGSRRVIVVAALASGRWSSKQRGRKAATSALRRHVESISYLEALVRPGAMRHSLDGQPVEPVDSGHAEHAATQLAALKVLMAVNVVGGHHHKKPLPPSASL